MHQTRKEASIKLPIRRKGTKYVARALGHLENSVPVVIAVRDMLKLASTAREVDEMIKQELLKVNHRIVRDRRESINLFGIFHADKDYRLTLLPTKRFTFEQIKNTDVRVCKITSRRLIQGNKIQLNLHDGSNVLGTVDHQVGDSVYLDKTGKLSKHLKLAGAKEVFIMSGKYVGSIGKVSAIENKFVRLTLPGRPEAIKLPQQHVIVL